MRIEPLVYRDAQDNYHVPSGETWNTNTLSGPNLGRPKAFFGFRLGWEMLAVTFELGWGIKTDWDTEAINPERIEIGHQVQVSGGVGMDF